MLIWLLVVVILVTQVAKVMVMMMTDQYANHAQCTQHTSKIFEKKSG